MKKYCVILVMLFLMMNTTWAKVRNGYEKDLSIAREKLENYTGLVNANGELSYSDSRNLKKCIKRLQALQAYYELTDALLKRFKLISPDLYNRVDSIKDARGRPTDVFVKVIPPEEAMVLAGGITCMSRSNEDADACSSEYGTRSVSIKIWIFDRALFALAHEFGHVNYQVPNLDKYARYYKKAYQLNPSQPTHLGHSGSDWSGKNALTFEHQFRKDHFNFLRLRKNEGSVEAP